jgi:hypothetical protein
MKDLESPVDIPTSLRFDSWQGENFSILNKAQSGSEAHPASYTMGIGDCFLGDKAAVA